MKVFNNNEFIGTKGLTVLIYGDPGIGKTTLANTAPKPILLDFDRGAHRSSLGKKIIQFDSWQDLIDSNGELNKEFEEAETIIVDTAGTLLDYMTNYLTETQPLLAKNGIKLWGELKKMFSEFFLPLKTSDKNIIFIAHAKEKEEGDIRIKRPLIQGSSYDLLMQSCDLIGYYSMKNNRRYLTFDLTDNITAKNCADIEPVVMNDIPAMHSTLGDIINKTKEKLVKRTEHHKQAIDKVKQWEEFARDCEPSVLYTALQQDQELKKTEKTAVWAKVSQIMTDRGFKFNKTTGIFETIENEA